jgi:hypothetical protein
LVAVNKITAGNIADFLPLGNLPKIPNFNGSNYKNYTHPKILEID